MFEGLTSDYVAPIVLRRTFN